MGYSVGYFVGGDWFSRKMKEHIRLLERGATTRFWLGVRKEKKNEDMKRRMRKESRLGTWKRRTMKK